MTCQCLLLLHSLKSIDQSLRVPNSAALLYMPADIIRDGGTGTRDQPHCIVRTLQAPCEDVVRRVTLALSLVMTVTSAAAADKSYSAKDWFFQNFGDGTANAFTNNDSGSTLGIYCAAKRDCVAYLKPGNECENGSKYPVLLNANSGALLLNTTCASIGTPESKQQQFVMVLDNFDMVLNTLLKDHALGIAIPLASGKFKVTRFSLEGSNEALAAVGQSVGETAKPVGTRDEVL